MAVSHDEQAAAGDDFLAGLWQICRRSAELLIIIV
jgi:hypothetical protein